MKNLFRLRPFLSYTVWGGEFLKQIRQIKDDRALGETWEISSHPRGSSMIVDSTTQQEKPLSDLVELSYLFKLIDAQDHLSVQVHPDDEFARLHENESGKTECWIILKAQEGSGIYLGLKNGVTKKEFKNALQAGLAMNNFLNFIPVRPGDFYVVPAGSIHAIGKGVTLAEVQQNSGVTYRVWDWGRVGLDGKPRELHTEKAMSTINFGESFNRKIATKVSEGLFDHVGLQSLYKHQNFSVEWLGLRAGEKKEIRLDAKEGVCVVSGKVKIDEQDFDTYDCALAHGHACAHFEALERSCVLLIKNLKNG